MILEREHTIELLKASPLAAFWGTVMAGIPWDKISYFLASLYSAMVIGQMLWKWIKRGREWLAKRRAAQ